jgi:phosphohistidine phosphatase SixA
LLTFVALSGVHLPTVRALVDALYAQTRLDPEPATAAMAVKTL